MWFCFLIKVSPVLTDTDNKKLLLILEKVQMSNLKKKRSRVIALTMRRMFTSRFIDYFGFGTWLCFLNSDKNGGILGKFWKMLSVLL